MSDELKIGEPHPSAIQALSWMKNKIDEDPFFLNRYLEIFSSLASEGNRMAEVCVGTIKRLISARKIKVGDRYLLGLAWTMRCAEEDKDND